MEWYEYLSPHTLTGALTFVSVFTLGIYAHIKVYSPKEQKLQVDKDHNIVQ